MTNLTRVLIDVPNSKVSIIKMVRDFIDLGLKEAKDFVEAQYPYELELDCKNLALELLVDDEAIGRAYRRSYTSPYSRSWRYISMGDVKNIANLAHLRDTGWT